MKQGALEGRGALTEDESPPASPVSLCYAKTPQFLFHYLRSGSRLISMTNSRPRALRIYLIKLMCFFFFPKKERKGGRKDRKKRRKEGRRNGGREGRMEWEVGREGRGKEGRRMEGRKGRGRKEKRKVGAREGEKEREKLEADQ